MARREGQLVSNWNGQRSGSTHSASTWSDLHLQGDNETQQVMIVTAIEMPINTTDL